MPTPEQTAVAEFAKGLLAYVEDGNMVELRDCGFVAELRRAVAAAQCPFGFTPRPDCDNCGGTGVFEEGENGEPLTACHFCLSDAIRAGELDGVADDVEYRGGKPA